MKIKSEIYDIDDQVSRESADWLMRLKAGNMTSDTEKRFYVWLSEDSAHQDAYELIRSIWDDAGMLATEPLAVNDLKENWVKEENKLSS